MKLQATRYKISKGLTEIKVPENNQWVGLETNGNSYFVVGLAGTESKTVDVKIAFIKTGSDFDKPHEREVIQGEVEIPIGVTTLFSSSVYAAFQLA